MSRNLWKLSLILFILAWSLWELYPPTSRNLIQVFRDQAETSSDTNFIAIVNRAIELEKQNTNQAFKALKTAVGTNDLARYFPALVEEGETDVNQGILNRIQQKAAGKIKLGLDLQGGISFLVSMDTNKLSQISDKSHALDQAVEVLRKRVDRFGVAEPLLQPEGDNRILIQLPGLSDADKDSAKNQIQKAAFLEFRLVHPESAQLAAQDIVEPGYEIKMYKPRRKGVDVAVPYLVKRTPERGLTGSYVERSGVFPDPVSGQLKISLKFNSEGAKLFGEITRENVGHQLAIILDGELYSAPNINEPIMGGNCEISGQFDQREAFELANVLQNPLQAPVHIEEEHAVDPSLGKDTIESGVKAALIGTAAVVVFMLVYYMIAGMVANVALLLNIVILLGVMCSVGTTLTLPGIAGIVLTIGMAVDANVLIYERLREELAAGKSLKGAISAGYDRAFSTIFDSHFTTLISSVILIYMGTGPVKGFGVALTIGVALSLFTALVVTRLIFDWLVGNGVIKKLPMLHIIRKPRVDFMKYAFLAFAASWTLILIGNGYGVYRGKQVFGVDFAGGDRLGLSFVHKIETDKVRNAITDAKLGEPFIQYERELSGQKETLYITTESAEGKSPQATSAASPVEDLLKAKFPEAGFRHLSLDHVGATVGEEIRKTAILASLLAMFGILIYVAFRYEFSFAVGAVIAIIHDILMTLGCFFLSGRQLSAPMVAAILTIIGFSINDTIVIFDRIREDLKLGVRGTFKEVMNMALSQTLSRTIITSGTVFLSTLSLYLFGGGAVNDFAFTFLVGIITGTYSSIYIASTVVLWWHKGERPKLGSAVVIDNAITAKV